MIKNKEIQEKRMRDYFIQATKDILKGEGIRAVSVRSIADRAGYSYATMYNYFKDANELIFLCVSDFQQECKAFVTEHAKKSPRGKERLRASVLAYIHYFVEYPGIFELFYLAKVSDFGNKQTTIHVISNSLDNVCEAEWNYCLSHKLFKVEDVEMMKGQLKHLVVGLLLLYMNRMIPSTYPAFISQVNVHVDHLLG
jgi:AcrR family transcriptional regulator